MTKQTNKTLGMSHTIDQLVEQRRRWEEGTYAASNTELYALLGKTLDLFIKVRSDIGLAKAVTELMDTYGIAYNSSTTLAVKIIRLVFVGKERQGKLDKRSYVYARVLTVAAEQKITGATLAQFIIDNHGIEEIRRSGKDGVTDAAKAKDNRSFAEAVLANQTQFASVEMTDDLQPVDGSLYSLALLRKNDDGTASIVFGTNSAAPINSVLALAGKALKQRNAEAAESAIVKTDAEIRASNIERLFGELGAAQEPEQLCNSAQQPELVDV